MLKCFYDAEFIEDGSTIDLISIGVVDNLGREFYAISTEFNSTRANPFVRTNVLPLLPPRSDPAWMSRRDIRDRLYQWLTEPDEAIELWAYYGAYDHVALAQLFGGMANFPERLPMYTNELMQLWTMAGEPKKPPYPSDQHDALADARWNRDLYEVCTPLYITRTTGEHGPEPVFATGGEIRPNPGTQQ